MEVGAFFRHRIEMSQTAGRKPRRRPPSSLITSDHERKEQEISLSSERLSDCLSRDVTLNSLEFANSVSDKVERMFDVSISQVAEGGDI